MSGNRKMGLQREKETERGRETSTLQTQLPDRALEFWSLSLSMEVCFGFDVVVAEKTELLKGEKKRGKV